MTLRKLGVWGVVIGSLFFIAFSSALAEPAEGTYNGWTVCDRYVRLMVTPLPERVDDPAQYELYRRQVGIQGGSLLLSVFDLKRPDRIHARACILLHASIYNIGAYELYDRESAALIDGPQLMRIIIELMVDIHARKADLGNETLWKAAQEELGPDFIDETIKELRGTGAGPD